MIKTLKKYSFEDKEVSRLQDSIDITLTAMSIKQILDGNLIKNVALKAGEVNKITHKLGRTLQGWIIVRKHAGKNADGSTKTYVATDVWDTQDDNALPASYVDLWTEADVIVDLWCF